MPETVDPMHLRLHKPLPADLAVMDDIRRDFIGLAAKLHAVCPFVRERSIALTHLETSLMYAIKSLAIRGEPVDPITSNPSVE